MSTARILLIGNNDFFNTPLVPLLEKNGLRVSMLEDGRQALETLADAPVALVLLDGELPGESGLSVCRRLRDSGIEVAIILVSERDEVVDRILGLEMGADDYLVKPFEPTELLARIRVQLRRQVRRDETEGYGSVASSSTFRFGPFELDPGRRLLSRAGEPLVLTRTEFAILDVLTRHPTEALPRERIYKLTRRRNLVISPRCVDIQISRLRRVLEEDTARPRYIRTIWGVGYAFFPQAQEH
jgi:two-component system phosphate regulon response regulator OmpR